MKAFEATEIVAILVAAYPQTKADADTAKVYETMLADLDFATARNACARLIGTSKWFPTVAEIRATVADLKHGPRRLGGEAWGDVGREIRRVGAYGAPRFEDAVAGECVRLMGWRNLCLGDNDVADRARFIELYDGLQERHRSDLVSGYALPAPRRELGSTRRLELPDKPIPASERPSRTEIDGMLSKVGRVAT